MAKKCARRAVDRNRLKRVVRESFRMAQDDLPDADFVVLCRAAAPASSNARLFASMSGHWKRIQDQLCASC
jgi:ribonuclease P protein component